MSVSAFIYAATRPTRRGRGRKTVVIPPSVSQSLKCQTAQRGRRAAACKSATDERVSASDWFSDLILMHGGLGANERAQRCSLGLQTERRTSARPLGGRADGRGRERLTHTHTHSCLCQPPAPRAPSPTPWPCHLALPADSPYLFTSLFSVLFFLLP